MTDPSDDEAPSGSMLTILLLVTLAVSLLLNAYMIFKPPPRLKLSCPTVQPGEVKVVEAGGKVLHAAGGDGACEQRLSACQQAEVSDLLKVIRAGGTARPGAAAKPRLETRVGAELQQSVLCDVTRRKQRRRWYDKRHKIAESLMPNLTDAKKQQRDMDQDIDAFSRVLGWDAAQRARFAKQYAPARKRRVAAILTALKQEPVAFTAISSQVRGLFADEDRLVQGLSGDRARRQLRAARLENRTVIVAIAAAMADAPWDHSLTW